MLFSPFSKYRALFQGDGEKDAGSPSRPPLHAVGERLVPFLTRLIPLVSTGYMMLSSPFFKHFAPLSLPLARLVRPRGAWTPWLLWTLFSLWAAYHARGEDPVTHILLDHYAPVSLPLLVFGFTRAALGRESLRQACAPLVALGATLRRAAWSHLFVTLLVSAFATALLGAAVVAAAYPRYLPFPFSDAATTAYVGALGAMAYGGYFTLGATKGGRGWGLFVLLILDWLVGRGDGFLALWFPRSHVRSLLGGASVMGWSQSASTLALMFLALVTSGWAVRRVQR